MNPFRRIARFFRRKPAMIGTPPSARPVWHDPEAHAADFAARYAEPMNYLVEQRMMDLGIPTGQIGSSDTLHGIKHAAFMPHDRLGGSNGAGGRLTVDSGVFNTELLAGNPGEKQWRAERLANRLDAVITHEYEEAAHGGSHVAALERGPDTDLPIRDGARKLLRAMRNR
jgi:hypothetical protein